MARKDHRYSQSRIRLLSHLKFYLRLQYQNKCKIVPVSEVLAYQELEDIIRKEFNVTQWEVCV